MTIRRPRRRASLLASVEDGLRRVQHPFLACRGPLRKREGATGAIGRHRVVVL